MSKLSKPTVSPLPPGAVIVTEHEKPHAAQIRSWAKWFAERSGTPGLAPKELRAAADYVERMEQENAKLSRVGLDVLNRYEAEIGAVRQEAQTLREERDRLKAQLL